MQGSGAYALHHHGGEILLAPDGRNREAESKVRSPAVHFWTTRPLKPQGGPGADTWALSHRQS
jgi:hypothetical protein